MQLELWHLIQIEKSIMKAKKISGTQDLETQAPIFGMELLHFIKFTFLKKGLIHFFTYMYMYYSSNLSYLPYFIASTCSGWAHMDQTWPFLSTVIYRAYPLSVRPSLKIFWFAVYWPTQHFIPNPIIFLLIFEKKNIPSIYKQFRLKIGSFS